eukprot:TRINITY_DN20070_c0_g1_i1.p1 TRINITY_DN20070_c0_g1~~TRINITY_DN20070_c0_g1_i1.p1  ORF type:complete len:375 (-),score=87.80 TRINITY_DN20070_c0_g1_i1:67-1143(-)
MAFEAGGRRSCARPRPMRQIARLLCCASLAHFGNALGAWFEPSAVKGDVCIAPVLAPDARSPEEERHRHNVYSALARYWGDDRSGYGIPVAEESSIASAGRSSVTSDGADTTRKPSTYGEVTPIGVRQIGRELQLDSLEALEEPVVFADLGSGVGKLAVQAFLEFPRLSRAIGVELSSSRASSARAAWQAMQASGDAGRLRAMALRLPAAAVAAASREAAGNSSAAVDTDELECEGKGAGDAQSIISDLDTLAESDLDLDAADVSGLELIEGDIFKIDLSEVTHIYASTLCFDDALLRALAAQLSAKAPQLRRLATLRPFPEPGLEGFEEVKTIRAQMSWTVGLGGGATVRIYERKSS